MLQRRLHIALGAFFAGRAVLDFGMHGRERAMKKPRDHLKAIARRWILSGYNQAFTTMSLVTDFAPRTSEASFVTSDFSASELASPVTWTTPSVVVILV